LKAASAPETSQQAWVVVSMRFSRVCEKNYLSNWAFTVMQSVHIRMSSPLSPLLKGSWIRLWKRSSKTKDHTMVDWARWRHKHNITACTRDGIFC